MKMHLKITFHDLIFLIKWIISSLDPQKGLSHFYRIYRTILSSELCCVLTRYVFSSLWSFLAWLLCRMRLISDCDLFVCPSMRVSGTSSLKAILTLHPFVWNLSSVTNLPVSFKFNQYETYRIQISLCHSNRPHVDRLRVYVTSRKNFWRRVINSSKYRSTFQSAKSEISYFHKSSIIYEWRLSFDPY